MCIRDRATTDRDPLLRAGGERGARHQRGPRAGTRRNPPRHCLLYTSDAADERSSVDLGGRRIIKKKKSIDRRSDSEIVRKTQQQYKIG